MSTRFHMVRRPFALGALRFLTASVAGMLYASAAHAEETTPAASSSPKTGEATPAPGTTASETESTAAATTPESTTPKAEESAATPKKDEPKKEEPKAEEAPKSHWVDPFAGTSIFTQTGANFSAFSPGFQPDYNPTVQQFTSFSPRFRISKKLQLRGRITYSYEYTNNDSTTYRNQPTLGDTSLQLFYQGIPAFGSEHVKLKLSPFIGLALPTSLESRARTLITSPSLGVQAALPIEHLLGGEWLFLANATYAHPLYTNRTAMLGEGERDVPMSCFGTGGNCGDQLSGAANPSDTITWAALISAEYGKFSPGAYFLMSHQFTYKFNENFPRASDATGVRQSSYFAVWLDYHLNSWLTPEIGYQMFRSTLASDGTYGNPFFSKYQDPTVYLGFNIQLDAFIKSFDAQGEGGGVVRADNHKANPIKFY